MAAFGSDRSVEEWKYDYINLNPCSSHTSEFSGIKGRAVSE